MHLAYETIRPVYDPAKYVYDYDKNMESIKRYNKMDKEQLLVRLK